MLTLAKLPSNPRRLPPISIALAIAVLAGCAETPSTEIEPRWVLWVWERPEDLSFLDADPFSDQVEVAILRLTITLSGETIRLDGRAQPLRLPKAIDRWAVVRIESDPARVSALTGAQVGAVSTAALAAVDADDLGLQIDFDARQSERGFYRELLESLRNQLPKDQRLSVAGLASWCDGDRWIGATATDEIVPMLYRMGPEGDGIRRRLDEGRPFAEPRCRRAIGLSSDEPIPRLPPTDRIYLFHPQPWTRSALDDLIGRLSFESSK